MYIPGHYSENLETILGYITWTMMQMRIRIRESFYPGSGIRDGKKILIQIRVEHPRTFIPRAQKQCLGWILKFFSSDADPDPGSGMEKIRIRDKHPGSATLGSTCTCSYEKSGIYCTCCVPRKDPDIRFLFSVHNIISYPGTQIWLSEAFAYKTKLVGKFVWNLHICFFFKV